MAGIGFELKRLFAHKGILLQLRANIYAGAVVAGPMLLGTILIFGFKILAMFSRATEMDQDTVVVIIMWALLFPLILTNFFTYVMARYVADQMYEDNNYRVMPSMYAVMSICLLIGAPLWGVFLYFNKLPFDYTVFAFILFCEAIIVWIQISYTNAVKDYRSVMLGFVYGIITSLGFGALFIWVFHWLVVPSLLLAACLAYAVMILSYTVVLHSYFPLGFGTSLKFVEWIEKFPSLVWVGAFSTIGLFAHLMIYWASPYGVRVIGYFYTAPMNDVPAFLAFFTILVTTVNFVSSVEVKFYSHYRVYFGLLNEGGAISDIEKAYNELAIVLKQELLYLAQIQLFVTVLSIVILGELIGNLGLGFNSNMIGLFRVYCIGYGLFAIGNTFLLFQMYVNNYKGAFLTAGAFMFVNIIGSIGTLFLPEQYYGFGFLAAGLAIYLVGWQQLSSFIKRLDYHIYCKQPVFISRVPTKLSRLIQRRDLVNFKKHEVEFEKSR